MKVMLVNGSVHEKGNTYLALIEVQKTLFKNGVDSEIFYVGKSPIAPCMGCGACAKTGKCVINDKVNNFIEKMETSDGLIVASPVHFASPVGSVLNFLSRSFFSGFRSGKEIFRLKPAASIAVARRAGTSSTLDELNKFFSISEMPVISGRYWNNIYGQTPGQIEEDLEGVQNLQILSSNFAYFLKCKQAAKEKGIEPPKKVDEVKFTNFIR